MKNSYSQLQLFNLSFYQPVNGTQYASVLVRLAWLNPRGGMCPHAQTQPLLSFSVPSALHLCSWGFCWVIPEWGGGQREGRWRVSADIGSGDLFLLWMGPRHALIRLASSHSSKSCVGPAEPTRADVTHGLPWLSATAKHRKCCDLPPSRWRQIEETYQSDESSQLAPDSLIVVTA